MAPRIDRGSGLFLPKPWLNQTFGTTNLVQHIHPCRPKNLPSPRHIAPKRRYATSLIRLLLCLKIRSNTPQEQNTLFRSFRHGCVRKREREKYALLSIFSSCESQREPFVRKCAWYGHLCAHSSASTYNASEWRLPCINSPELSIPSSNSPGKYPKRPCAAFQHRKKFHFASKVNMAAIIE